MSEIPSVKVLEAIKPANAGKGDETLAYDGLAAAIEKYRTTNKQRYNAVWEAVPGSLEELSKAKQLASEYLLRTSAKVVNSHESNRDLWSDRFTQAATELYGEPEQTEAARLLSQEISYLTDLQGDCSVSQQHVQMLIETYNPIVEASPRFSNIENTELDVSREKLAILKYGEAIKQQYQPLFDLIISANKPEFTSQDLQELFTKALNWLKQNDDQDWSDWEANFSDSTHLSVDASNRKIKIGTRRETASPADARALLAHELLVHALRAKNGYKTDDKKLATGLPVYLSAEEGLGIIAEEAVNGILPDKTYDRYIDIALALGTLDNVQRTRQELFQISYARQLVRSQHRGDSEEKIASLAPRVWGHIDRIYRGGCGDNLGTRQAIFTKDIAYYIGYKKMAGYITDQMANGKSAKVVFAYLSQAKFDPLNPQHIKRLSKTSNQ